MIESMPIPELAKTCVKLAQDQFNRLVNDIAAETLDTMGLKASDGYIVNFATGEAQRDVPDHPPENHV